MGGGKWIVVETLGAKETWSVLAVDGKPTEWKSLTRTLPAAALPIISAVYERREPVERILPPSRQLKDGDHVRALPVPGPDGVVHGVHIWIGGAFPEGSPPAVSAFTYGSRARLVEPSADYYTRFGVPTVDGRSTWTGPEVFRRVVRFDTAMELIGRTIDPTPDDRWQGQLSARLGDGIRRLSLALRNDSTDGTFWRSLIIDTTDSTPPEPVTVETAALAALRARDPSTFIALLDLASVRLIRWVTDPVPGIAWKGVADDRDTPHPDDVQRIFAAAQPVITGAATSAKVDAVRLRRRDGGWTIVDTSATVLPHTDGPKLILAEFVVTGFSDEPDPVPPPAPKA